MTVSRSNTQEKIKEITQNMRDFLVEKNRRYGDSALSPCQIFSKAANAEQLCSRIDDKLSRIKNADEFKKNDLCDLVGYLLLLMISLDYTEFDDLLD